MANSVEDVLVDGLSFKQMKQNLNYYKQLKDILEAHETRAKSVNFKRNAMQMQKVANYQNEKERIMGEIPHNETIGLSSRLLKRRKEELARLSKEIGLMLSCFPKPSSKSGSFVKTTWTLTPSDTLLWLVCA